MRGHAGNLSPLPGIFPDYSAPIVRNAPVGVRELVLGPWGMPSSQFALMEATKKRAVKIEARGGTVDFKELLRLEPDIGTTNVRNVASKLWQRWLGVENIDQLAQRINLRLGLGGGIEIQPQSTTAEVPP